jgi:hypothetical protein
MLGGIKAKTISTQSKEFFEVFFRFLPDVGAKSFLNPGDRS